MMFCVLVCTFKPLVENGYASSVDNIEYDLSADEVYVLYQKWADETGNSSLF